MKKNTSILLAAAFALVASAGSVFAITPEELAKRQARSVHLRYAPVAPNAVAAEGTVRVVQTQTNTYYCILAWDTGYCGIQDKGADGNILIFSVWDPSNPADYAARPETVKEELRAKVLYAVPKADVARFGGEGTGARTMMPIDWKSGEKVSVRIEAEPDGDDRYAYTCSWLEPKTGSWVKIATVSTLKRGKDGPPLGRIYSFVEDFWRNYRSATLVRRAEFGQVRTKGPGDGAWTEAKAALFTGDSTPSNAVDAGSVSPGWFYLQTGGDTAGGSAKLRSWITGR